jgi:co-chaperonin GroES (HSP10)
MTEKIKAVGKNILIERKEKKNVSDGGIILLENVEAENFAMATVISAAESYYDEKLKKEVKLSVKPGDVIVYKPESALKVDGRYLMINEDNIFAIVEE